MVGESLELVKTFWLCLLGSPAQLEVRLGWEEKCCVYRKEQLLLLQKGVGCRITCGCKQRGLAWLGELCQEERQKMGLCMMPGFVLLHTTQAVSQTSQQHSISCCQHFVPPCPAVGISPCQKQWDVFQGVGNVRAPSFGWQGCFFLPNHGERFHFLVPPKISL